MLINLKPIIRSIAICFTLYFFSYNVSAQTTSNSAFQAGERLKFVGSYNMSSLWTDLAEVELEVKEITTSKTPLLHLKGTARTYPAWDNYFKIRDSYQSWVLPSNLKPLIFKRDMYEGGYTNDSKYVFKRKSNLAVCKKTNGDGSVRERNVTITSNTYDVVSMLYHVRNLDYENYQVNKRIPITILIDEALQTIQVIYLGKETIKVNDLGSVECYKLGLSLKDDSMLENNSANNIWLTADLNRVPVFIKAEIPVGSVQIRITEMHNLKN